MFIANCLLVSLLFEAEAIKVLAIFNSIVITGLVVRPGLTQSCLQNLPILLMLFYEENFNIMTTLIILLATVGNVIIISATNPN